MPAYKKLTVSDIKTILLEANKTPKARGSKIQIVTSLEALAQDLYCEVGFLKGWKNFRKIPTQKQFEKIFLSSIKSCEEARINLSKFNETLDQLASFMPSNNVLNLSNKIEDLLEFLEDARPDMWDLLEGIGASNSFAFQDRGMQAETYFIGHALPRIYRKHTNMKIGYSVNPDTKKPHGPMLRFIRGCCEMIGISADDKRIVNCITSVKKHQKGNS